jgi:benzoate-CoA ligase family protein
MASRALAIPEQFNAAQHFVDRHVDEGRGNKVAVLYRSQALTYGNVATLVNRAANAFVTNGIRRGDRVVLLLLDSPSFAAAFWGAIKLGAVPVPLNTVLPAADYEFILCDSGARGLVVHETLLEKIQHVLANARPPELGNVWVAEGTPSAGLTSFEEDLQRSSPDARTAPTHRDDPAFWLYTSGSTGRPKAAIHAHRAMVCCVEFYAKQVLGITSEDRTFSSSKLFFAYGLGNGLYFPAGVGASTILLAEKPTTERIFDTVSRFRPTMFFAVPAVYASLLQAADTDPHCDFSSVRCAVSAGEALPAPLWERFRERFGISILDGIGSTEMLHMFISNRPGDTLPGSSGKLVPGYEARIVDEEENDVTPGQIGNLWIHGGSAASGYWNRPDLTRAAFRRDWTVTGDKYTCDDRGYFFYCGRSDDMLKVSGLWVAPLEIESALMAHPAVLECAVVGITDGQGLTKPKAFVVMKDHGIAGPELETALREFLRDRLPRYKVPQSVAVIDRLPRTATGKIQRFRLRHL